MNRDGRVRRRLAIVTSNYWPEPTGTSQTVSEFGEYAVRHGLDVRVVTSMPYYPQWRIWPEYRGRLWSVEDRLGLRIYRSWHWVSDPPSALTRVLHEMTLTFFALCHLLRVLWWSDVAYVVSPALGFAFAGIVVARLLGRPVVLVIKDVQPDAAVELGMVRSRVFIGVARFLSRWMYRLAGEIHTLGDGMRRRILVAAEAPVRVRVVPDTIDPDELAPVPAADNEFRRRFVPDGVFAVVHTGNMGKKQDLHLLLRAARRLRGEPSVRFYVFGDGAVKQEFLRLRDEWSLDNVLHFPLQERRLLPHMLSGADLLLISQLPAVVDIVVPSKLITAMAAGAAIVAACAPDSETARIVEESGGGVVIPASDDVALVRVIEGVRAGVVEMEGRRRAARAYAIARFSREAVYGPLIEEMGGVRVPRRAAPARVGVGAA